MFALVPILLEVFFVLLKPQELWEILTLAQPLYTIPGLIALGFVFDAGRFGIGASRMMLAPFWKWALFFFAWTIITVIVRAPAALTAQAILFGTAMLMSMAIAHCVQTWQLYRIFAGAMLALTLFLSFVGTHQATAPFKCFYIDKLDRTVLHYDGHSCPGPEQVDMCVQPNEEEDRDYVCEHAGLMGTASVSGRIRFRGNLEDPNELSLTVGIGFPFAVAFWQRKKGILRAIGMAGAFGLIASCVFYSQSRGGQVVLLLVLATFFIRRYGWKWGGLVGGVMSVPMGLLLAMSGRSESEAEGSTLERIECLQVGLDLVRSSPLFGVGKGQFGEYHFLTAHNSFVLAAAETGLVGFAVWSFVIYLTVKIPIAALRQLKNVEGPDAAEARIWSTAMLASLVGLVVGSFFLSFSFHPILWIYIGIAGALAGVLKKQFPTFQVGLVYKEMALIAAADLTLLAAIFVYARIKVG